MIQAIKPKTNNQLERAKRVKITSLYKGNLKPTGQVLMGLCIAHDDHNPSMAIYPVTNTWNCFACNAAGDSVAFYMQLHNCDFKTAIQELSR